LRQVSAAGGGGRAGAGGPGRLMRAPPLLPPDNIVAHVSKVHNLRRAGAQRLALSNRPHARAWAGCPAWASPKTASNRRSPGVKIRCIAIMFG